MSAGILESRYFTRFPRFSLCLQVRVHWLTNPVITMSAQEGEAYGGTSILQKHACDMCLTVHSCRVTVARKGQSLKLSLVLLNLVRKCDLIVTNINKHHSS